MVIVLAVMLGLLDEIMQSFNPGRSADWTDLLADTIGAGLGVLLCRRLAGQ
jgi:VanZ family protein